MYLNQRYGDGREAQRQTRGLSAEEARVDHNPMSGRGIVCGGVLTYVVTELTIDVAVEDVNVYVLRRDKTNLKAPSLNCM